MTDLLIHEGKLTNSLKGLQLILNHWCLLVNQCIKYKASVATAKVFMKIGPATGVSLILEVLKETMTSY